MTNKWKNLLLALILLVGLSLPMGIVGADNEEVQVEDDDPVHGTLVSADDSITVTKLDQETVDSVFGGISLERDLGLVRSDKNVVGSHFDASRFEVTDTWGVPGLTKYNTHMPAINEGPMTRASDDDSVNDDFVNGSSFSRWGEEVTGSLTHSNVQSLVDGIDWYQLDLHDDTNPSPMGTVSNVSFELTDYSSTDTLYEFALEDDGSGGLTLAEDYADFMTVFVANYDTMTGLNYMGGTDFYYDDGDDTDGWVWDGDNSLYPDDNWTFHFVPPLKAEGNNDADGFANGFTEDGFVWVGLTYSWFLTQTSPQTRDGFEIDYEFTLDRATQTGDAGSNDYKNATAAPSGNIRIDSCYNQMDWYQFTGTDHTKLWNMSFSMNWTWLNAGMDAQYIRDNWLYVYILWYGDGQDDTWGTADDGLTGVVYHYTYFGIGSGGIFDPNGNLPIDFNAWLHNNWTDAPQTPEDMRKAYVGFLSEPQLFTYSGNQITGQYIPDWRAWSDYNVQLTIGEYAPNNQPTITEVTVQSDFEQDPTGGYYDSEFILEVTYQDDDDDPPSEIWVYIDKDTPYEKASDISNSPTDVFDMDYTDGKTFKLEMIGDDLTDDPYPHTVHVEALDDVPEASIRSSQWSDLFEFTDGIRVWDDEPVDVNPNRQQFDELMEDDPTTYFPLEGIDGQFKDPENSFEVFYIWNETHGNWSDNYDSDLMNIDVVEYEGIWQIAVTPKHNQYGSEPIRLQGEDEHSWVNLTTSITVREVNDPPMVDAIEIDGVQYEVDNVDPRRPVIHLEGESTVEFKEDIEYTFSIIARDTDLEEDWTQLEYSYVRSTSSDWDEDPDVGYNTGEVTFTPTNNDVKAGNDKMVFSIDDHREDGDIKLEIYLEIENVNDDPTLMIPTTTARTWKQFSKIQIRPIAADEDKNDQITFSVNFEEAIGTEYESIEDQLPFMEVTKGIDWDITPTTGDFWFEVDDQKIWKTSSGMVNQQEITIVFQATDKEGGFATASISLVLNDENEEPPRPDAINVNPVKPNAKEPVNFWVDPVEDPDGDRLTYKWDFGDGSTGEGINVNHTYATKGYKTVQMWVEDGQFSTEKISLRVEVAEEVSGDDDVGPDDDDDDDVVDPGTETDNTMIIIVAVIIIVVVILVVVLFIFLLLRKKPAPTAQMYPGYDQQALGAYAQQGLPPGAVGELPPQATPELPPAAEGQVPPDNLPPAEGQAPMEQPPMEPQPEVAPAAPETAPPVAAAPEMAAPESAPEQPAGDGCPSCGAAVDPTWFLCPNCKSPLQ
jgi:hypothetical protein